MTEEQSVLRWGGLAGIVGAILFVLVVLVLVVLVPAEPTDPEELVRRFPDVRASIAIGEGLFLAAVVMWVPLFLALFWALRGSSPAPALFGSVIGILGLATLAVGALPHLAFATISDLYRAPGTTPEDQATLVLLWQSTQGMYNESDTVGILLMAIGFIVLGVAMLRAPTFGKGWGWVSAGLGMAVVVGASIIGVHSVLVLPFVLIAFIILPLLVGWKVYRVSSAE